MHRQDQHCKQHVCVRILHRKVIINACVRVRVYERARVGLYTAAAGDVGPGVAMLETYGGGGFT